MYPGGHACSVWPRGTHHKTKNNNKHIRLLGRLPLHLLPPIRHRTRMHWARMGAEGIVGTEHSGGVGGGPVCKDNVSNGVNFRGDAN